MLQKIEPNNNNNNMRIWNNKSFRYLKVGELFKNSYNSINI